MSQELQALRELAILPLYQGLAVMNEGKIPYSKGEEARQVEDLIHMNHTIVKKLLDIDKKINKMRTQLNNLFKVILRDREETPALEKEVERLTSKTPDSQGVIRAIPEHEIAEKLDQIIQRYRLMNRRLDSYKTRTEEIMRTQENLEAAKKYYQVESIRSIARLEKIKSSFKNNTEVLGLITQMQRNLKKVREIAEAL
jgi:hypothetical protein